MLACDVCAKKDKLSPAYEYLVKFDSVDEVVKWNPLAMALCKDCASETFSILIRVLQERTK